MVFFFLLLFTSAFQLPGLKTSTCFCNQNCRLCVCFLHYQSCGALLLDRPNWMTSWEGIPWITPPPDPATGGHWKWGETGGGRCEPGVLQLCGCWSTVCQVPNASSARFSPSVNIVCHCLANFQVTLEVFILGHGFYKQLCLSKTIIPNWGLPCPYQKALSPQLCQEKGTQALPYLFQARQFRKIAFLIYVTSPSCLAQELSLNHYFFWQE